MKLNADIGESYGNWTMGSDAQIMPLIDQANIACGYHAGDALTMQKTLGLVKQYAVQAGAHVSYPDIQGFGRRSMKLSRDELIAIIHAQMATLEGMAMCQQIACTYVKPHGAMYNDMMQQLPLFELIVEAIATYHSAFELVIQALPDTGDFANIARKHQVKLRYEAFADRAYTAAGFLVPRSKSNAVLTREDSLVQAKAMVNGSAFLSEDKTPLTLTIDTICVHCDTPDSLALCAQIRSIIDQQDDQQHGQQHDQQDTPQNPPQASITP